MSHYYTKSGEPCHFQPDGKDTTLRHARKQDLVPSVTGILDVASNPGLSRYFENQILEAAWQTDDGPCADYAEWCKEVRQTAGEHSKNAREAGIRGHNLLESYYSGEPTDDPGFIHEVSKAIKDHFGLDRGDFEVEKTFSTEYFGGAVDLSHPEVILDYKFKAKEWEKKKDGTPKKMWFDSHISQLSAYRQGLGYKTAAVANVFISPKAEVFIKEWTPEEIAQGEEYFRACLKLWNCKNKLFGG